MYHIDGHIHRVRAVEHEAGHHRPMLDKRQGRKARIAVLLGTGRKLRPVQRLDFLERQPEHEIRRESLRIALYRTEKLPRGHVDNGTECSEIHYAFNKLRYQQQKVGVEAGHAMPNLVSRDQLQHATLVQAHR
ncbi:MAG: hypothetical protein NDI67_08775 [Sulfuritalea sp.]|nr:hypothetical protein [Sulfuritalea sp.]